MDFEFGLNIGNLCDWPNLFFMNKEFPRKFLGREEIDYGKQKDTCLDSGESEQRSIFLREESYFGKIKEKRAIFKPDGENGTRPYHFFLSWKDMRYSVFCVFFTFT